MKLAVKFAIFSLIVTIGASPVMACLAPGSVLTAQEKACCREMGDQCGEMGMTSSHSCCKPTVRENDPFVSVSRVNPTPICQTVGVLVAIPDLAQVQGSFEIGPLAHTHSPPVALQENISILRI